MGWWDCGIMGGDTPWDIAGHLTKKLGLEAKNSSDEEDTLFPMHMPDCWSKAEAKRVREALNKYGADTAAMEIAKEWRAGEAGGYWCVLYQVVGLITISCGAELPVELKLDVMEACDEDEWAKEDEERKQVMEELKKKIEDYQTAPSTIRQHTLMEKIVGTMGPDDDRG